MLANLVLVCSSTRVSGISTSTRSTIAFSSALSTFLPVEIKLSCFIVTSWPPAGRLAHLSNALPDPLLERDNGVAVGDLLGEVIVEGRVHHVLQALDRHVEDRLHPPQLRDLVVGGEGDRDGRLVPCLHPVDALNEALEELSLLHHNFDILSDRKIRQAIALGAISVLLVSDQVNDANCSLSLDLIDRVPEGCRIHFCLRVRTRENRERFPLAHLRQGIRNKLLLEGLFLRLDCEALVGALERCLRPDVDEDLELDVLSRRKVVNHLSDRLIVRHLCLPDRSDVLLLECRRDGRADDLLASLRGDALLAEVIQNHLWRSLPLAEPRHVGSAGELGDDGLIGRVALVG
mmetsp:Transcript_24865/g.81837  ORF Transcript_24865/g.81837 Transcript_24865/m.81837 type:complete len:347 (-) Transcript_24865:521-1561(-)